MQFMRAFALVGVLGFCFLAAGCSGQSGATPPVQPAQTQGGTAPLSDAAPVESRSTMSTTSTTSLVGQVVYMTYFSSTHEFQIKTTTGTAEWIATGSNTSWSYNGLTLKVGDWVTATGSTSGTILSATSVSLSSTKPSSTTTSGTPSVIGQIDYSTYFASTGQFQIKSTSGAYDWIKTNSTTKWTYNGLSVKAGVWVAATGSFASNTLTATSVSLSSTQPSGTTTSSSSKATPPPSSGVPKHVQTGEYLTTSYMSNTSPSVFAPYLTWAYTLTGNMGKTQAAGIKTVIYASPIMPNHNTYEYSVLNGTYPSTKAKTCAGTVITTYNGTGLLNDPTKSSSSSYFQTIVSNYTNAAKNANPGYAQPWNLIFVDNDGPLYGASATPCNFSPTTWSAAQDTALATTGQKFLLNSLSVAETNVSTYVNRLSGSAVAGGMFEECFMTSLWQSEGDSQLQTVALLKKEGKPAGAGFWCYADNTTASAAYSIPLRNYTYASFLLTYDPNYSVYQDSLTTPSTFKVLPETGFVPMSPVSIPLAVSDLQTSSGAYLREYNNCYYRGSLVGKCEIVVNPSTSSYVSIANPWGLKHSMVMSGSDVLDGGTVSFTGSVPSKLAPKSGIILTP